ncbi:MAG: creatininase family protein [Candidatus Binatia bacterium]
MPIVRAEDLTYTKLRAIDMSRAVCFQPVSALEVHGPHLPYGMDFYMARWMAEESGRRFAATRPDWTVVQHPVLPLGTDELPLAGSMNASQRTVYNAVRAHGASLARAGYRYIVVTNGHGGPRHAAALEAACRRVSRRHGVQMFTPSIVALHALITGRRFDAIEASLGRPLSEEERHHLVRGEHAGTWETAFMLAQDPSLVEADYTTLEHDEPPPLRPLARVSDAIANWQLRRGRDPQPLREVLGGLAGGLGWLLNTKYGYGGPAVSYHGTPRVASVELGHAFRDVLAGDCLAVLERVTSGAQKAADVRSIASDPAIIQPHFWPRAAAAAALLALILWW